MKKTGLLSPAVAAILLLVLCGHACGQTDAASDKPVGLIRQKLSVNRALIAQFEANYLKLKEDQAKNPTAALKKKIGGVETTLKALHDDADRLRGQLPDKISAQEYMKELVQYQLLKEKVSRAEILGSEYRAFEKAQSASSSAPAAPTAQQRKKTAVNRLLSKTGRLHERGNLAGSGFRQSSVEPLEDRSGKDLCQILLLLSRERELAGRDSLIPQRSGKFRPTLR